MELNNTEQIIEDNLELLQDIHAKNYTGTDDDMPEKFNDWVSGFSLEELQSLVSIIPPWLDDSILDTLDEITIRPGEAPLNRLKRLTNYE
jgi:hypothetical protein